MILASLEKPVEIQSGAGNLEGLEAGTKAGKVSEDNRHRAG